MGYCKYCRKSNVEISQFDRFPDGTLIRNKKSETLGICEECEREIPSTKKELLEAHAHFLHSIHMHIVIGEILNTLPDAGEFNLKSIYEEILQQRIASSLNAHKYRTDAGNYDNLKRRIGYIVIAASRMKQETTPSERKQAARSIFLKGLRSFAYEGMGEDIRDLEKEYGKWYMKV